MAHLATGRPYHRRPASGEASSRRPVRGGGDGRKDHRQRSSRGCAREQHTEQRGRRQETNNRCHAASRTRKNWSNRWRCKIKGGTQREWRRTRQQVWETTGPRENRGSSGGGVDGRGLRGNARLGVSSRLREVSGRHTNCMYHIVVEYPMTTWGIVPHGVPHDIPTPSWTFPMGCPLEYRVKEIPPWGIPQDIPWG